jgi:hypothetical protein
MAIEAETNAPSSDPPAAPGVDLGVLTAFASICPITSASQAALPIPWSAMTILEMNGR